jgi:mono/diheme cytochrome c family protein
MGKRMLVAVVGLAISAGVAEAQTIKRVPAPPTSTIDGKQMYDSYCAVCHGKEGTGNGPAAKALTKTPADLTRLSARNGGTFPEIHVKRFIEGLDEVPAHGTRDMPMWGFVFRQQNSGTAPLRVQALSEYLKGMQQK